MRPVPWAEWVECANCGARTHERGNGLTNRCEPCRVNMEDFAGRVLGILRATYTPEYLARRKGGGDEILQAAIDLGLLAQPESESDYARDSAKDDRATGPGAGAFDRGREDAPDTERERNRSL